MALKAGNLSGLGLLDLGALVSLLGLALPCAEQTGGDPKLLGGAGDTDTGRQQQGLLAELRRIPASATGRSWGTFPGVSCSSDTSEVGVILSITRCPSNDGKIKELKRQTADGSIAHANG